jgi:hypothetical protein
VPKRASFARPSRRSASLTIAYRRDTASVLRPVSFVATGRETTARSRFRTAVRRQSFKSRLLRPARCTPLARRDNGLGSVGRTGGRPKGPSAQLLLRRCRCSSAANEAGQFGVVDGDFTGIDHRGHGLGGGAREERADRVRWTTCPPPRNLSRGRRQVDVASPFPNVPQVALADQHAQ